MSRSSAVWRSTSPARRRRGPLGSAKASAVPPPEMSPDLRAPADSPARRRCGNRPDHAAPLHAAPGTRSSESAVPARRRRATPLPHWKTSMPTSVTRSVDRPAPRRRHLPLAAPAREHARSRPTGAVRHHTPAEVPFASLRAVGGVASARPTRARESGAARGARSVLHGGDPAGGRGASRCRAPPRPRAGCRVGIRITSPPLVQG